MHNTDTKKQSILRKFKTRTLKNIWEEGENIFAENNIKNIFSLQKENSQTVYIKGEVKAHGKIYTPSLYYDLTKNYVEVFTCSCQHDKKGPCSHITALLISIVDKFYTKEKNTLDFKTLNSGTAVSFFKNFMKNNNITGSSYITFKIKISDDKKIFLTNFHILSSSRMKKIGFGQFFSKFFNSFLEKGTFTEYLEEKEYLNFEEHSYAFLNILENYFRYNRDKINEKRFFELPNFLLPSLLPLFPYLCQNYITKEKEPEILISLKNNFIVFEIKDFKKWKYLENDYLYYKDENNFIKFIFFPKYEIKKRFLNCFALNSHHTFCCSDINLETVVSALRKIAKIKFSDEIISKYYIPEKIESGILITGEDEGVSAAPVIVYDGRTKEQIEKTVLSDKNLESRLLKKAENYISRNTFLNRKAFPFYSNSSLFQFLSHDMLKTPPDFHILFNENMKDARFASGHITLENVLEGDKIKIKIISDTFSGREIAEIFQIFSKSRRKYYQLKNNSFLLVKDFDSLRLYWKLLCLNASYEEILKGEFYRPDIFYFYVNNISFNSMNMKNFIGNFSPEGFSLRDYQNYGVNWLLNMKAKNWSGILSDGTALGKKLEILTFLYLQNSKSRLPNLILTHDTLEIADWEKEVQKFYKNINYKIIDKVLKEEENTFLNFSKGEIIFTTYQLFAKNSSLFKKIKFENIILSKSEYLKDLKPSVFKHILKIKRNTAYALTNLPISFLINEIWWIISAAVPDYFPDFETFRERYFPKPNIKIKALIKHLFLRREKSSVEKELPQKIEKNIFFLLEKKQRKVYDAVLYKYKNSFNSSKNKKQIFYKTFYELKNIALIPLITALDTNDKTKYIKFKKVSEVFTALCKNRYKTIVISETPSFFKIKGRFFEKFFVEKIIDYDTSAKEIERLIEEFNKGKIDALFISSKVKLPKFKFYNVDAVIYTDPWHSENIEKYIENNGLKSIIIYNFYALDTIEEKIYKLKSEKNISNFNFSEDEILNFFE